MQREIKEIQRMLREISFFDEDSLEQDFDNDRLEFLVGACGSEFSEAQMQLVSDLITNKIVPENQLRTTNQSIRLQYRVPFFRLCTYK